MICPLTMYDLKYPVHRSATVIYVVTICPLRDYWLTPDILSLLSDKIVCGGGIQLFDGCSILISGNL